MTLRPLPRSLDPLAGESLAGYVLRLAHRLDRAPGRIAVLTGLGRGPIQAGRSMAVPVGRLLHLDTATVAAFAHATRLSAQEVAGLCLDSMRDRYPPLDLDYQAAGSRQTNGITGLASWVFTQSTRYCPECLAGDGSPIQQAHGGAWRKLWHLPPVFACTLHRRLLLHQCPQCQQPVHSLRGTPGLFPRLRDATPHPAQCLTTIQPAHWSARTACGARLDTSTPSAAATDQPDLALVRLLGVQHKLTGLLQPVGDRRAVLSGSSPAGGPDPRVLARGPPPGPAVDGHGRGRRPPPPAAPAGQRQAPRRQQLRPATVGGWRVREPVGARRPGPRGRRSARRPAASGSPVGMHLHAPHHAQAVDGALSECRNALLQRAAHRHRGSSARVAPHRPTRPPTRQSGPPQALARLPVRPPAHSPLPAV